VHTCKALSKQGALPKDVTQGGEINK
jgi:hypothetical protein